MDRGQKWTGPFLCLFIFQTDPGIAFSIIEGPRNATVLAGSAAHFNCTLSEGWESLIWLFNGSPRLILLRDGTTVESPRYSQQGYPNGSLFTSELTISDVQLNDSGQIKCSIMKEDDNKYAFLTVQESDNNEDEWTRTIILAVALPIVGLLLLILIILLIVWCCKRRKEPSYPNKVQRKEEERNRTNENLETTKHRGNENYGYSPEAELPDEQMPGDPTFSRTRSSVYEPQQDLDMSAASKVPYNKRNKALPSRTTEYPTNQRKIRNVTIV